MDEDKRADLIFQMQQILIDDAAVLIDGYYNSSMIYSKNVGYAKIHTADYYWLSTEIVPAEMKKLWKAPWLFLQPGVMPLHDKATCIFGKRKV